MRILLFAKEYSTYKKFLYYKMISLGLCSFIKMK